MKEKKAKKKGMSLYNRTWLMIVYVDIMFIILMYISYTTARDIIKSGDPTQYLSYFSYFCGGLFLFLVVSMTFAAAGLLRRIRRGFRTLSEATQALAEGNTDITLDASTNDEFGYLMEEYMLLVEATRNQEAVAEAVAAGDMTADVILRGDKDRLGHALMKMVESTDASLSNIKDSAYQVSTSSSEVASASESLAQGSTEQASAIEQITASIDDVAEKTKMNADEANTAAELVEQAIDNVYKGNEQMQDMMAAMQEINISSESISKIIKVIDDIAFQTNILALNAAVEAARAGEAGKGFAVVAEEVRNLAAKSAQAAAETAELIEDSMRKVESGSSIAEETASALEQITEAVKKSAEIIVGIKEASNYQATAISQINQAIDQVSQVVQTNSATSEQCAAASIELSNQANTMKDLISVYKLRGGSHTEGYANGMGSTMARVESATDMGADYENQNEQIISLGNGFGKY